MSFFNTLVAHAIPHVPRAIVEKFARRYIAGDDLSCAVTRMRQLNTQGCKVTVDVLGETTATLQQAETTANEYVAVLRAIKAHDIDANVSVKPTAFGLWLDAQRCKQLLERVLTAAAERHITVCLDMEDTRCTQLEIDLFNRLKMRHPHVELVLQAYLQRTYQDIEPLVRAQTTLRICKGIYVEDEKHLVPQAGRDRQAINSHFLHHVARCFDTGSFVGVATHDEALIAQVITLAKAHAIDHTRFEFQMLLGVCEPLRDSLLSQGYNVRIYLPYGSDWYGYSTRRMKENPRIAGHVLRAMLNC